MYFIVSYNEYDEEEMVSKQDIGTAKRDFHKYTVFHQNDAEYKTMSNTEQPNTEEETEISILPLQPKVIVPQKINKGLFTPNFKWKSGTPFQSKVQQFFQVKVVFKKSLN